jgi:hypothetical protein
LKEIQPLVGGKENTLVVMANQLLPNSSIGETITPIGVSVGDDELSNLTCELCFEKPATICLEVWCICSMLLIVLVCQFHFFLPYFLVFNSAMVLIKDDFFLMCVEVSGA